MSVPDRMALYQQGKSDREIARIEGGHRTSVKDWRRRRGLPPNVAPRVAPVDMRRALYEAGLSDCEIARREGCNSSSILSWRRRNALPPHRGSNGKEQTPAERAARMLLYSFKYSDVRIAKEQGVHRTAIRGWRVRLGLPAHLAPGGPVRKKRSAVTSERLMLDRIKRAMPAYLSPADRDDAAGDLFLAVLSGEIAIEDIEARAKKFGNKVIADFASKWGARSLDEELGEDGDGFRMIDMIRDDRSSSWLEEMGASVW